MTEIVDIAFYDDHDLFLDNSDIAFTAFDNTRDVLKQRLTIRLQFLYQEWFLDNRVGIPYTQFILEQGSSLEDIYSIFRKEIKDTEGVENIQSLEFTHTAETKTLRVDFSVNDGTITDTIEVNI